MIAIWLVACVCTLAIQSPLGDPVRALSIDGLIWLRDRALGDNRSPADNEVVVISIDETTYQTPPFRGTPRVAWGDYLAKVINELLAVDARVIGFDIVLSTSLDARLPGVDRELLKALHRGARHGKIVLGELQNGQTQLRPFFGYRAVVDFDHNIRPVDVTVDPDGVVRRIPILLPTYGTDDARDRAPSMALELAIRSRQETADHSSERLAGTATSLSMLADRSLDHDQEVIFNLRRQNIDIPTYSLADLYLCAGGTNRSYFARHFSNKTILIGSTLDVEDQILSSARFILPGMKRSPVETCTTAAQDDVPSRLGLPVMPGVYLHAAMVQNLINDDLIKSFSPQFHAVLTLIVIGFLMMASVCWSPVMSMSILSLANAVFLIGSILTFASNLLVFFLVPAVGSIIGFGGGLSLRLLILERRRRRVRDAFNHLLPSNVVEQLIDRNEIPTAGGRLITCTVLLTDLENYTSLAEQLKPDELVDLLNQVNQVLDDVVERHGGIVSWHAGDSLLALFGAPIECTDHAAQGVRAAIDCCSAVSGLNRPHLLDRNIKLRLRVGVSTGKILVGYIGSNRQLTYSAIGDHVNIASRLEGLNKIYGTSVLVNETTRFSAEHDFDWKPIDRTFVKGRKAPVGIFEPTFKTPELVP